jgi:hypothetical protein
MPLTPQEKYLYHQIHPVKLLTDWSAGLLSLYFFWRHDFVAAAVIALIPAVVVSWMLIRFSYLERRRASRFGHDVRRYMIRTMEAPRLVGLHHHGSRGVVSRARGHRPRPFCDSRCLPQWNKFWSIFKMTLGCKTPMRRQRGRDRQRFSLRL